MRPHSRRFLDDIEDTLSIASAPPAPSSEQRLPPTINNGNNDLVPLTPITGKPLEQSIPSIDSASISLSVVVLLIALCFVGFFSVYIHCLVDDNPPNDPRRRQHQTLRERGFSSGIDLSTIQSLPLFAYDGNVKELVDCPICLTEFEEKEIVKMIPFCGHLFHPQCIDMWLSAHGSCPICRSTQLLLPLPLPPHGIESDGQQRTRANSFSSSSRVEDRVYLLPRSNSF
ncbi:RING-H2 finger protein ATL57-like [Telopea speciosissima]|uniref:RING-H2 finger protein ATL57-like n=1 Tax=Telopea speciosissima TaxID=54955 RepID=UPI001CC4FD35|nr:RING-H2 finger protein ATL57-like [Telopea speciosissima]